MTLAELQALFAQLEQKQAGLITAIESKTAQLIQMKNDETAKEIKADISKMQEGLDAVKAGQEMITAELAKMKEGTGSNENAEEAKCSLSLALEKKGIKSIKDMDVGTKNGITFEQKAVSDLGAHIVPEYLSPAVDTDPTDLAAFLGGLTFTKSPNVRYVRSVATLKAAPQGSSRSKVGAKLVADYTDVLVQDVLYANAIITKHPDQDLEDVENADAYVQNKANRGVVRGRTERFVGKLLSTTGSPNGEATPANLPALVATVSGVALDAGATEAEVAYAESQLALKVLENAVTQIKGTPSSTNSFTPNGIIISAAWAAKLKFAKDKDGHYMFPGVLETGREVTPIGLRIFEANLGEGNEDKVIVCAIDPENVEPRSMRGVKMDRTNSDEDDFQHNITSFRAEERCQLIIKHTAAFCVAEFPAVTVTPAESE